MKSDTLSSTCSHENMAVRTKLKNESHAKYINRLCQQKSRTTSNAELFLIPKNIFIFIAHIIL